MLNLHHQPGAPIEVITWRGEARVVRPKPALTARAPGPDAAGDGSPASWRDAFFRGRPLRTPVYHGAALRTGQKIQGPAIISETTTTIVLIPGCSVLVRPSHYLMDVGDEPRPE